MVWWRLVFMLLVFALPGGSLLLLALAGAKALGSGRQRLTKAALAEPRVALVAETGEA